MSCQAITKKGEQCKNKKMWSGIFCSKHRNNTPTQEQKEEEEKKEKNKLFITISESRNPHDLVVTNNTKDGKSEYIIPRVLLNAHHKIRTTKFYEIFDQKALENINEVDTIYDNKLPKIKLGNYEQKNNINMIKYVTDNVRSDVFLKQDALEYLHKNTWKIYLEFLKAENIEQLRELVLLKFPDNFGELAIKEIDRLNKFNFCMEKLRRTSIEYITAEVIERAIYKYKIHIFFGRRVFLDIKEIVGTISSNLGLSKIFDDVIPIEYLGDDLDHTFSGQQYVRLFTVNLTQVREKLCKYDTRASDKIIRIIRKNIDMIYHIYTEVELMGTGYSNPNKYLEILSKRISEFKNYKNENELILFIIRTDLVGEILSKINDFACKNLKDYLLNDLVNFVLKLYIYKN
jgi:hypothetical protein